MSLNCLKLGGVEPDLSQVTKLTFSTVRNKRGERPKEKRSNCMLSLYLVEITHNGHWDSTDLIVLATSELDAIVQVGARYTVNMNQNIEVNVKALDGKVIFVGCHLTEDHVYNVY